MDMWRVIVSYSRFRLELEILRVQRMKIQHHKFLVMTTIRLNNVALAIALIILLNQNGGTSKQQADEMGVKTHQAALFATSTQGLSVLLKY